MPLKYGFCGGRYMPSLGTSYSRGECERADCPRARLGYGSWHEALPKLHDLNRKGQLKDRYPDLNLQDLQQRVNKMGKRVRDEREHRRDQREYGRELRDRQYAVSD